MSSAQLQLVGPVVITKVPPFQFAPLPGDRCCRLGCFRGRRVPWSDGEPAVLGPHCPLCCGFPSARPYSSRLFSSSVADSAQRVGPVCETKKMGSQSHPNALKIMPE